MVDYGYGVDMSNAKFIDNAAHHLLRNFASAAVKQEFEDFCEDNPELVEDGTAEEVFVDEFEDDITCGSGIEGFIVRCINDNECPHADAFAYSNCCIYVGARIPANAEERAKMLTQEDIQGILAKYLNPILESELTVEFLEIYE